jgi:hypothetical protein
MRLLRVFKANGALSVYNIIDSLQAVYVILAGITGPLDESHAIHPLKA